MTHLNVKSDATAFSLPQSWQRDELANEGRVFKMGWGKPQFTRSEVDKTGQFLVDESLIASNYAQNNDIEGYVDAAKRAYGIINNWRSSHYK